MSVTTESSATSLGSVAAAVHDLADVDVASLTGAELEAAAKLCGRLADRLAGVDARVVAAYDAAGAVVARVRSFRIGVGGG